MISRGEQKVLFLVQDDRVQETIVRTGESFGEMVEIISGAKAGDKVVLRPNRIKDGAKIKIAEK